MWGWIRAKFALASFLLLQVGGVGALWAKTTAADVAQISPSGVVATVAWAQLPPQAQRTYTLIRQGGPFPYAKDGTVFGNRERLLPRQPRGYYREYTVQTPGSRDRGARRIVCGGPAREPQHCYYTADHYASFRLIVH